MPNIDDFCYMRRGHILQTLTHQQLNILEPINVRGGGHDRALLLLHGFSSTPAVYRQLWPAFTHYDAIVCPVLPGHGESITSFSKTTAEEWLLAAEQACKALLLDYSSVDVMGLSLGGLLACQLSHRLDIHHLYLLAPALALKRNVTSALRLAYFLQRLGFRMLRNQAGNIHGFEHGELTYRQLPITTIIEMLTLIHRFEFSPPSCPTDLFFGML